MSLDTVHNHTADEADEIVREIRKEIIEYQVKHPETLPDMYVFLKYEAMFVPSNVPMWEDIVAGLGQKTVIQRHKRSHRSKATGKQVLNTDDFDFEAFLSDRQTLLLDYVQNW